MFVKLHSDYKVNSVSKNFYSLNENCQKYFNKNDRWKNYGQNLSRLCYTLLKWRKKINRFQKRRKMHLRHIVSILARIDTCYGMQTRESTKNRQLVKGPIRYL